MRKKSSLFIVATHSNKWMWERKIVQREQQPSRQITFTSHKFPISTATAKNVVLKFSFLGGESRNYVRKLLLSRGSDFPNQTAQKLNELNVTCLVRSAQIPVRMEIYFQPEFHFRERSNSLFAWESRWVVELPQNVLADELLTNSFLIALSGNRKNVFQWTEKLVKNL